MSLDFIKEYAPNLSKEAEDHAHETSEDNIKNYAKTTTNQKHISKLLNHSNIRVIISAVTNPNISDENLDKALNYIHMEDHDMNVIIRSTAAEHPNVKEHHINKALDDDSFSVRFSAASNPKANAKNIDKALDDDIWTVRAAAVRINHNATKENIHKALNDRDDRVRSFAKQNPRYNEYFPNGHE